MEEWVSVIKRVYDRDVSEDDILTCIDTVSKNTLVPPSFVVDVMDELLRQHSYGFLENFYNSCYMDSVLYALLITPNNFIDKLLTKRLKNDISGCTIKIRTQIQKQLLQLRSALQTGVSMKCINFRNLLTQCTPTQFENFGDRGSKDADEFLKFLFYILDADDGENKQITYGTNSVATNVNKRFLVESSTTIIKDASPIFDINYQLIKGEKYTTIQKLIATADDSGELDTPLKIGTCKFNRRIQYNLPYKHKFLVIHLQRKSPDKKFNKKFVLPNLKLKLEGGNVLLLRAIIIWKNNHYTLMLRSSPLPSERLSDESPSEWLYFNDIDPIRKLISIGSYKDMVKYADNLVLTNGTLFFYY